IETAPPVGWAVGLVFSLVLALAAVRVLAKSRLMSKPSLVILYSMLTLGVPVMNIGLIRPVFLSIHAVEKEYFGQGNDTYRTAYNHQPEEWFPKVPTKQGLAWNKADRLLELLRIDAIERQRSEAKSKLMSVILAEKQRLEARARATTQAQTGRADLQAARTSREEILQAIEKLGPDEAQSLRKWVQQSRQAGAQEVTRADALASLEVADALRRRETQALQASDAAAERLPDRLEEIDEFPVSQLPSLMEEWPLAVRGKIEAQRERMTEEELAAVDKRIQALSDKAGDLREQVTALSGTDLTQVRADLRDRLLAQYNEMPEQQYRDIRSSFVFRLTQEQRKAMMSQSGEGNQPDQNLDAFSTSLWSDLKAQSAKKQAGFFQSIDTIWQDTPWHLWVKPMVLWGMLFTTLYLLLMCTAEWLRRKWIERENLAFPLVEVADNFIRHDYNLEEAEDDTHPTGRGRAFNPVFLFGLLAGIVWIAPDAMAHYGLISGNYETMFDVSSEMFKTGNLKEMSNVVLVLSPIVLGIAFLVSLEISFSVWVIFFIYSFLVLTGKLADSQIKDSLYTGWGGGRNYPFPMAQMIGAALCFTGVLLYKAFRTGKQHKETVSEQNYFIPPRLNRIGFIVLPLVLIVLLWHYGVLSSFGGWILMILTAVFVIAQTIAQARLRAETGLHTHHVSYEYTKLPIVFGMTGLTGAGVYTQFISLAFLPISLLFRSLATLLENMELARRNRMNLRTVAIAGLVAFLVATSVGMVSFLLFSHYYGGDFQATEVYGGDFQQGPTNAGGITHYPLWVSHFQGEFKLDNYTEVHGIRIWFMLLGFAAFGLLTLLRNRFLKFPLHPIGYMLILFSISFEWITPYFKGDNVAGKEASWLWGSVFLAWLIKKLVIKYGGMNTYKRAKPFFIGMVVGAVFSIFAWDMIDLACSLVATGMDSPGGFMGYFLDKPPYTPTWY
ncbi:MAG: DUF6785 family protein, partial [Planctomycetota bacterium]